MDRILTNGQRAQLHALLVSNGVDPAVTSWTNHTMGWCHPIAETLEVGMCHFLFKPGSDGSLSLHMKPSPNGGPQQGFSSKTWEATLELFNIWASSVKHELSQEDPWAKYSTYFPPERIGGETDNSPFTHAEAEHAAGAVLRFLQHVKESVPDYKQIESQFDPQFERLADQAKKGAGRIDWSNQFVGMLIALCMTLSLSPDTASSLWQSWISIIDGLFLP